jgi:hypothetical protein
MKLGWVLAGIVAWCGVARAEHVAGGYVPFWDSNPDDDAAKPVGKWHAGVRIGPYLPEVDRRVGDATFEEMFGGARAMPVLDIDRIVWRRAGQITVGVSAGYMQWFAHAFADGTTAGTPMRARGPDANRFRFVPLAVTATYRLTYLAEERGIPVIPYLRGGLAYDVWWLTSKHDHMCEDGGTTCKSQGASAGVLGAIGLAIRAERIDPSSATSMHQSGIDHAGIYAELSVAKVDGFGAADKLSLGDKTWSAGVDFEF